MKDALGVELKPGDYLVYPQRYSSTLWIVLARIISIEGTRAIVDRMDLNHWTSAVKRSYTEALQRAIKMPTHAIPDQWRVPFEGPGPYTWDDYRLERTPKALK